MVSPPANSSHVPAKHSQLMLAASFVLTDATLNQNFSYDACFQQGSPPQSRRGPYQDRNIRNGWWLQKSQRMPDVPEGSATGCARSPGADTSASHRVLLYRATDRWTLGRVPATGYAVYEYRNLRGGGKLQSHLGIQYAALLGVQLQSPEQNDELVADASAANGRRRGVSTPWGALASR